MGSKSENSTPKLDILFFDLAIIALLSFWQLNDDSLSTRERKLCLPFLFQFLSSSSAILSIGLEF